MPAMRVAWRREAPSPGLVPLRREPAVPGRVGPPGGSDLERLDPPGQLLAQPLAPLQVHRLGVLLLPARAMRRFQSAPTPKCSLTLHVIQFSLSYFNYLKFEICLYL